MRKTLHLTTLILSMGLAGASCAESAATSFTTGPWVHGLAGKDGRGELLALNGTEKSGEAGRHNARDDELPWYSKNRMHKYLGLGSMGLALATLAAPKERGGAHENLAKGAAFLGGAAVANGIYAHWDDMEFDWDDPDTRHAIFGALGTLGYLLAVSKDGEGGHAALGGLGAVSMAYAIKISW